MSEPFRYYLRVRYGECDAQKVVYNARYADYVDIAVSEYMRALGFREALVKGELDYQVVKLTLEWRSPARYDDVVEVRVSTLAVGTTSFTLGLEFRIAGREEVIVRAECVNVRVHAVRFIKEPLGEAMAARLRAGAAGIIVDHAAYLAAAKTPAATDRNSRS